MNEHRFNELVTRLSAVYGAHAPTVVECDDRLDRWVSFAPALLARAHYAFESIAALRARPLDAAVLCRVLYEHVTTFAWLAIDPARNLPALLKREAEDRGKAAQDLASFEPLRPEWQEGIEQFRAMYGRPEVVKAPSLDARAHAAETRWRDLLEPGLSNKYGFRGQYPPVFRNFSSYTHVTSTGLAPFITGSAPNLRIGRPVSVPTNGVTLAPVVFGTGLLVASEALGWPPRAEVLAAFEHGAPRHV